LFYYAHQGGFWFRLREATGFERLVPPFRRLAANSYTNYNSKKEKKRKKSDESEQQSCLSLTQVNPRKELRPLNSSGSGASDGRATCRQPFCAALGVSRRWNLKQKGDAGDCFSKQK